MKIQNVNVKQDNKMTQKDGIYSEEFKWKVVQDVLSGNLTKEEALMVYFIGGNSNIFTGCAFLMGDRLPQLRRCL